MHAHEHVLTLAEVAVDERDVLAIVDVVAVADHAPLAEVGRQARLGDAVHQPLVLQAVGDELGDGDEGEVVPIGERLELRPARRGAVVVEDLADDARRVQAGEPGQVHRGLGVADALQHPAVARPQRVHVARTTQVRAHRGGVHRHLNGGGAVAGADAGGHAEARRGIDAHGEGGAHGLGVVLGLRREPELIHPFAGEGEADHPLRLHHEVDHLGRDALGGADQVALVLAILVVRHDHETALADVLDRLLDGAERHASADPG